MTSNEMRQVVGLKPSNDPKADQLINSNISQPVEGMEEPMYDEGDQEGYYDEEVPEESYTEEDTGMGDAPISDIMQ